MPTLAVDLGADAVAGRVAFVVLLVALGVEFEADVVVFVVLVVELLAAF